MTGTARGARLVALSVGGGAALTFVGATAAHAGDAEAVGNQSATEAGQSLTVTEGADPTVGGMTGTVGNLGAAGANTGVNGSEEDEVVPGDARSAGNHAHNRLGQAATSSATGGGLTLLDQDAHIASVGGSWADTGFNTGAPVASGNADAWGNRSWSTIDQGVVVDGADGALRVAGQGATIGNLGGAWAETGANTGDDITSGNASAGGNDSRTATTQSGAVTQESLGAALLQQRSRTRNVGGALANTGLNETQGDESTNLAQVFYNGVLEDESTENDD